MVVNTPCALVVPEIAPKTVAGAAARQRHCRVRNEIALGILHRHRQRGGGHAVRRHRSRSRHQGRGGRRGRARIECHRSRLVHAAFGRGDRLGLCHRRGQRGGEHALRIGGAGDGAEAVAGAATRQRHRRAGNRIAMGILHRHRQRGGGHAVRRHRSRGRHQRRGCRGNRKCHRGHETRIDKVGDAPAAESSDVPADVPSVTHRL